MTSPYDQLKEQIGGVIWDLNQYGLGAAVSREEARALFDSATQLQVGLRTAEHDVLLLQASLIWHATFAASEPPHWPGIALLGAEPNGEVWFTPTTEESRRLYALLLTNCAVARCLCSGEVAETAGQVANTAINYLHQLNNPRSDRWMATLYVILAYEASPGTHARLSYAEKALSLLVPYSNATPDLHATAAYLAGQGDGMIRERGWFRRRSRWASLGVGDLFLFSE